MGSLIYIAAIILIAIISNVNKAAKNKKKPNARGGMPTFGGGGDDPLRRARRPEPDREAARPAGSGSGFPAPGVPSSYPGRTTASYEEHEHELSPAWRESPEIPTPDYETGEGMSLEQPWDREDSVQARTERMQRELERLQSSFDGMAGRGKEEGLGGAVAAREQGGAGSAPLRSSLATNRQALQNGLVWSEILGPPRSRQPHSTRR
ncbi:hypothetical protein PAECIP111892_02227 [Paenibacillus auburnensis]|uniref:Uncharacterized protein n=1 Tax=Paenibacillus auburnensis TaxID=2905649 RepID=A0ABN8G0S1_9BACL|nr:hypothetical protein [Paenibacillus auburnensis]CAH1196392.1 hypothetical protein PAECIP111892_02227 [Paenibacillus auburnensis]